jgi:hypothetical protein
VYGVLVAFVVVVVWQHSDQAKDDTGSETVARSNPLRDSEAFLSQLVPDPGEPDRLHQRRCRGQISAHAAGERIEQQSEHREMLDAWHQLKPK